MLEVVRRHERRRVSRGALTTEDVLRPRQELKHLAGLLLQGEIHAPSLTPAINGPVHDFAGPDQPSGTGRRATYADGIAATRTTSPACGACATWVGEIASITWPGPWPLNESFGKIRSPART